MKLHTPFLVLLAVSGVGCIQKKSTTRTLDAPATPAYLESLASKDDFLHLSARSQMGYQAVKFTWARTGGSDRVYFQNTQRYPFHLPFLTENVPRFAGLTAGQYEKILMAPGHELYGGEIIWSDTLDGPPAHTGPGVLAFHMYYQDTLLQQDAATLVEEIAALGNRLKTAAPFANGRIVYAVVQMPHFFRLKNPLQQKGFPSFPLQRFADAAAGDGNAAGRNRVPVGEVKMGFQFTKSAKGPDTSDYVLNEVVIEDPAWRNATLSGTTLQELLSSRAVEYGNRHHNSCDTLSLKLDGAEYFLSSADVNGRACIQAPGTTEPSPGPENAMYVRKRYGTSAWQEWVVKGCRHFFADCANAQTEPLTTSAGSGFTPPNPLPRPRAEARGDHMPLMEVKADYDAFAYQSPDGFTMVKYVFESVAPGRLFYFDSRKYRYHVHFLNAAFAELASMSAQDFTRLTAPPNRIWTVGSISYNPRASLPGSTDRGVIGFGVVSEGTPDIAEIRRVRDAIASTTGTPESPGFAGGRLMFLWDSPALATQYSEALRTQGIPSTDFDSFWRL